MQVGKQLYTSSMSSATHIRSFSPDRFNFPNGRLNLLPIAANFRAVGLALILSSVCSLYHILGNSQSASISPNRPTSASYRLDLLHIAAGSCSIGPFPVQALLFPMSLLRNSLHFNASCPLAAGNSGVSEKTSLDPVYADRLQRLKTRIRSIIESTQTCHRLNLLLMAAGLCTKGPLPVPALSFSFSLLHDSPCFSASDPSSADNHVFSKEQVSIPLTQPAYYADYDLKQGKKSRPRVRKRPTGEFYHRILERRLPIVCFEADANHYHASQQRYSLFDPFQLGNIADGGLQDPHKVQIPCHSDVSLADTL